jgi:hypothetical protein
LPGERGAASARKKRSAVVAAERDGCEHVFFVARDYDSDGDLAIVRAVGGVDCAAALVETNFSAQMTAEGGFKGDGIELVGVRRTRVSSVGHKAPNIFVDMGIRRKGFAERSEARGQKLEVRLQR